MRQENTCLCLILRRSPSAALDFKVLQRVLWAGRTIEGRRQFGKRGCSEVPNQHRKICGAGGGGTNWRYATSLHRANGLVPLAKPSDKPTPTARGVKPRSRGGTGTLPSPAGTVGAPAGCWNFPGRGRKVQLTEHTPDRGSGSAAGHPGKSWLPCWWDTPWDSPDTGSVVPRCRSSDPRLNIRWALQDTTW